VQDWLRRRFEHPLTATWPVGGNGPDLHRAWVLFERPSDRFGRPLPDNGTTLFSQCPPGKSRSETFDCLVQHGIYNHAVYQPAERFWAFQWIEFAIFAGLSVALLALAVSLVRRRAV